MIGRQEAPSDEPAVAARAAFGAAGGDLHDAGAGEIVAWLGSSAPALLPLVLADPSIPRAVIAAGLESPVAAEGLVAALRGSLERIEDGPALTRALRRFRHRHLVRLAVREVAGLADVDTTAREMSALASACVEVALEGARTTVEARHGAIVTDRGAPMGRVVLGMGKLGGAELNLGSDVDLIFFYDTDEGRVGDGEISVHEAEAKIATRTTRLLSEATEDGFVFRVDLRLRPEGSRGPVSASLAAAERYYETFGRSWERAVLLRSAPVAGDRELGLRLAESVSPFVFRRLVDPSIGRTMHDMILRSRRELSVDPDRDVKLGRGGIREAEFFVQTLQLVWGGRHPELRVPNTLEALGRLRAAGLVSDREAHDLENAWALLRRVEHRIHVWAGYQTHRLPAGEEMERFARTLGFAGQAALESALAAGRERVATLFASLVDDTVPGLARGAKLAEKIAQGAPEDELEAAARELFGASEGAAEEVGHHLVRLGRHANDPLGPLVHAKHPGFGAALLEEIADTADPVQALRFTADFFARLRGWDYASLLGDRMLLRRFVALFGASQTLSTALVGHPEDLDVLLTSNVEAADVDGLHAQAHALAAGDDAEALVSALRRAKREVTLRVGIGAASGELDEAAAARLLGRAARHQIEAAHGFAERDLRRRFGDPAPSARTGFTAGLAVVAMGRLGSGELGFASDLDLVFFYDGDGETSGPKKIDHAELFARMAQQTMRLLSQPDAEGPGYATDMRLRPRGSQGTLVSSIEAFEAHHAAGSEAWERMALVRATPVAGEPALRAAITAAIDRVRWSGEPVDHEVVAKLRARIEHELAGEAEGRVHPKLGRGGLIDVEMLVQVLQLEHTSRPQLRVPGTREALLLLESTGLLAPADARGLFEAYTFLRSLGEVIRVLDESGDGSLHLRARSAERVCRRLGVRARADATAAEILATTYRGHTERVRAIFERVVAPVAPRV